MIIHFLAETDCGKQFRKTYKQYFLLNSAIAENPSTNILIGKVDHYSYLVFILNSADPSPHIWQSISHS